jgi:hypothetical protein
MASHGAPLTKMPNPFVIGDPNGSSCNRKHRMGRSGAQEEAARLSGRAYHCRRCAAWHVTSRDIRAWAVGRNR